MGSVETARQVAQTVRQKGDILTQLCSVPLTKCFSKVASEEAPKYRWEQGR